MKAKIGKALLAVAVLIIMGTTITGMVFSIVSYNAVKEEKEKQKEEEEEKKLQSEDVENVLIGGEYQIASTKNISDAYISGDSSKLNTEDKKTLEVASKILDKIITDDMSTYEKEKAVYDYICENVSHEEGGSVAVPEARGIVDRPYGVLQNNEAVCVGYATSFRLLVNMLGIDCMVMHDNDLSHSWDLVKLDDGCWYIVDCYFDADDYSAKYVHFNMNEKFALVNHSWDDTLYPVANGTEYCYVEMNKQVVENAYDMIKLVSKLKEENKNSGFFEIGNDEKQQAIAMYAADGIYQRQMTEDGYCSFEYYYTEDEKLMLVYSFVTYEDKDPDEPDYDDYDIDYGELDNKLDELFGEIPEYEDYPEYDGEGYENYKNEIYDEIN